jgi:undecaprenyl-diphosphatase
VQGVAEVVPVSSSAQLVLLPWLAGWEQPAHRTAFAAALHAGSCAGIAFALRSELRALRPGRAAGLLASCLPAAAAGLAVDDVVERRLGGHGQLAAALAAGGALLWLADRCGQDRLVAGRRELAVASIAQVAALVPGVSRSGATTTALRLLRVERAEASRTALLISLPVTAGAALLPLLRVDPTELRALAPLLAAGIPAAAVSGAAAATASRRRPVGSAAAPALYRLTVAAAVLVRQRRSRL